MTEIIGFDRPHQSGPVWFVLVVGPREPVPQLLFDPAPDALKSPRLLVKVRLDTMPDFAELRHCSLAELAARFGK